MVPEFYSVGGILSGRLELRSFVPPFLMEGKECGNCACSDAQQKAEDHSVEPTQARHIAPMQRLMRE